MKECVEAIKKLWAAIDKMADTDAMMVKKIVQLEARIAQLENKGK